MLLSAYVGNMACKLTYTGFFSGCTALKEVSMLNAVYLATDLFKECTALETVDAPQATTTYNNTFSDCSSLKAFDLSSIVEIGENAFKNGISIENITIGKNCTMLYVTSFSGGTALNACIHFK